jgi:hypothetical protein
MDTARKFGGPKVTEFFSLANELNDFRLERGAEAFQAAYQSACVGLSARDRLLLDKHLSDLNVESVSVPEPEEIHYEPQSEAPTYAPIASIQQNGTTRNNGAAGFLIGLLGALFLLGMVVEGLWTGADHDGLISHVREVDVHMSPDWMMGETRDCGSWQTAEGPNDRPEIHDFVCPWDSVAGTTHTFQVKFWGRLSRPDAPLVPDASDGITKLEWKCLRQETGLTCKAIN